MGDLNNCNFFLGIGLLNCALPVCKRDVTNSLNSVSPSLYNFEMLKSLLTTPELKLATPSISISSSNGFMYSFDNTLTTF